VTHLCSQFSHFRVMLCVWDSLLNTLLRAGFMLICASISVLIWCGCFYSSPVYGSLSSHWWLWEWLERKKCLFILSIGRGIVNLVLQVVVIKPRALNTLEKDNYHCAMPQLHHLPFVWISLFTLNVIFHMVSNVKFIHTYVHVWTLYCDTLV
jgi:hypothetical protein